jgi:glycosyltransferase involved in cell wall biosynthesis
LIEMAEKLKQKGVTFKLLIAGGGELGPVLSKMIQEKSLEKEVKLLGHVDDMTAFFNSLDLFVFSSLYEGSANTLIETLQHGIPTIAFDISSNPEIIQHGRTGYLAKPFEVEELVSYVLGLHHDPEMRLKIVEAGQRLIKEKFETKVNLNKLESIL